jgi:pimeloyl-ACP methyl ester carboxylesterase
MLVVIDAEDRFDAAPRLHRITAPTLVIAGDRDRNYTPSCSGRPPRASRAPGCGCTEAKATPASAA